MLPLHDKLGGGEGENVHNTDKIVVRSNMENCHANCQEARGKSCY